MSCSATLSARLHETSRSGLTLLRMSKPIRGNRVSPLWFLLAGIALIITGSLLVLAGLGGASAAVEGPDIDPQNLGLLILFGGACLALGVLSLLIWLVAFAITVALVETNRRLTQLNDDVADLRESARQQVYAPPAGTDLLNWRPGDDL